MAITDDQQVWDALLSSPSLAETTKSNHSRRLRFLIRDVYNRRTKTPLLHLLSHPAYALKALRSHTSEPVTLKTYLTTVLACFKHAPELKEQLPKELERWQEAEHAERTKVHKQQRTNQPTATQASKAVSWHDVAGLHRQMPHGSHERLMVALYTLVSPARVDYSPCKVVWSDAEREACERDSVNCLQLGDNAQIAISFHKTRASKGVLRKRVPSELHDEVEASLHAHPRSWLFASRDGKPWSKQHFRQRFSDAMLHFVGHRFGPSTLRHAFINALDFNRVSLEEAFATAESLGHNLSTMRKYHTQAWPKA
jgi:hypothetical protein